MRSQAGATSEADKLGSERLKCIYISILSKIWLPGSSLEPNLRKLYLQYFLTFCESVKL